MTCILTLEQDMVIVSLVKQDVVHEVMQIVASADLVDELWLCYFWRYIAPHKFK